jgi:hypothetical protein
MTLLAELEEFVYDHRPHGSLTADATPPGVTFMLWVTDLDAELDLLRAASLN